SSFTVCRVSSQAMRSAERSTRRARSVMSSRLPMGVATRYSPGARGTSSGIAVSPCVALHGSSGAAQQGHGLRQIARGQDANNALIIEYREQVCAGAVLNAPQG